MAGRIRVLVADDDAIVRMALASLFESAGDVELVGEAETGEQAVALAGRLQPDVVLMDYSMPELNGVEATRRIVALRPDCRVVGLSIHEDDVGDELCEAGAVTFVRKGSDLPIVLEAVRFAAEFPIDKPR